MGHRGLDPIDRADQAHQAAWLMRLATQPAQSLQLTLDAQRGALASWQDNVLADGDHPRFADPAWQPCPSARVVRACRGGEAWWRAATRLRGMAPHHQNMAQKFARQWLDTLSSANAALATLEMLRRTLQRSGRNLTDSLAHALGDGQMALGMTPRPTPLDTQSARPQRPHPPGVDVAITPGNLV